MATEEQKEARTKAKKKLKRHLERYANDPSFEVTDKKVTYWFNVINKAAFSEKLSRPTFIIKALKGAWGMCTIDKDSVEISIDNDISSRELFIATIAHEMVHQWQHLNENKMSHTGSYLTWKRKFKKKFDIRL